MKFTRAELEKMTTKDLTYLCHIASLREECIGKILKVEFPKNPLTERDNRINSISEHLPLSKPNASMQGV